MNILIYKLFPSFNEVLDLASRQGKHDVVITSVLLTTFIILSFIMYNVCKKMDFLDSDKYDTNFMITITLGILTVISLICFIITSFSTIYWILDPKAYGFENLLRLIR